MLNSLGGPVRPQSARSATKFKTLPNLNFASENSSSGQGTFQPSTGLGGGGLGKRNEAPGQNRDAINLARRKEGVKAAKLIAKFCQTSFRGKRARERVQLLRWHVANEAAKKIQRSFRRWKFLEFSRMHVTWQLKKKNSQRTLPWDSFIAGGGTYKDRISLWRSVAELRRLYRDVSPELCFKGLIKTQGEIGKASILLSNNGFLFSADSRQAVTEELKSALNPSEFCSREVAQRLREANFMNDSNKKNTMRLGSAGGARQGRSVRAHRHLQETIMNSSGLQTASSDLPDAHIDLRNEIMKCYFSTNYSKTKSNSK